LKLNFLSISEECLVVAFVLTHNNHEGMYTDSLFTGKPTDWSSTLKRPRD